MRCLRSEWSRRLWKASAQRAGERVRTWRSSTEPREPAREQRQDVDLERHPRSSSGSISMRRAATSTDRHDGLDERQRGRSESSSSRSCATPSSTRRPTEARARPGRPRSRPGRSGSRRRPRAGGASAPAISIGRPRSASAPSRVSTPSSATSGVPSVPARRRIAVRDAVHQHDAGRGEREPPAGRVDGEGSVETVRLARGAEAHAVGAPRGHSRSSSSVDALVAAHAAGADDRAQGADDPSLPADHLAAIGLGHRDAQDPLALVDLLGHHDLVGRVDQPPDEELGQLAGVLGRRLAQAN